MFNVFIVVLSVLCSVVLVYSVRDLLKTQKYYYSFADEIRMKIKDGYKIYMNGYALKRGEDLKYYHLEEENFIVDDNKKILYISY